MVPPVLNVCNGLDRPVDESMLARDTQRDIIASATHSLQRRNIVDL